MEDSQEVQWIIANISVVCRKSRQKHLQSDVLERRGAKRVFVCSPSMGNKEALNNFTRE